MNDSRKFDIYQILGIDPNHKSSSSNRPKASNLDSNDESTRIINDPNAPSGSIFDDYSTYPQDQQSYWKPFRMMTIAGLAVVFLGICWFIADNIDIKSPSFSRYEIESPEKEDSDYSSYERYSGSREESSLSDTYGQNSYAPSSIYGPFSSKEDLIDFLQSYYDNGGYTNASSFAETVETDFGTFKRFTGDEYAKRAVTHNIRHNIVGYEHNLNRNSVSAESLPDGGVEVSFSQIYDMTTDNGGYLNTSKYHCDTKFRINRYRKINYIWERARKIND